MATVCHGTPDYPHRALAFMGRACRLCREIERLQGYELVAGFMTRNADNAPLRAEMLDRAEAARFMLAALAAHAGKATTDPSVFVEG